MHSDLVLQTLLSDLFWLAIIAVVVGLFRNEVRNLLNSLGSFKFAGASFELKDSRATIESYVILTNVMIDALTHRDSAIKIGDLISDLSVRQLAKFAIKYADDVPEDVTQIELLKNIALIVGRRGDADSAIRFLDALLKRYPKDWDLLNIKANTLGESGDPNDLLQTERIQDELVRMRPTVAVYRFNRAITKAKLDKLEEAIADLGLAVDNGYASRRSDMLTLREFKPLRNLKSFQDLEARIKLLRQPL